MAQRSCPECGYQVSEFANACPKCGCPIDEAVHYFWNEQDAKVARKKKRKRIFWIVVIVLIVVIAAMAS